MKIIKLTDVIIQDNFLKSKPRDKKIAKAMKYFEKNKRLDKPIILNNGVLVDNYIRYLVAENVGLQEVPCVELQQMNYIIGKFKNNNKEYIWKNDKDFDIEIGDIVLVRTKYKEKTKKTCVTVVNVFSSNDLDLYNKHKSVLKKMSKIK